MENRRNITAAIVGGGLMFAAGGFFTIAYYANPHPDAQQSASQPSSNGLKIPTIDQMCKAQGATAANMAECQNDENQAGEFVIAWMGLNGFITNGAIDPAQIENAEELAEDNPTDSDPNADPNAEPNIDPATGQPVDQSFDSKAELAMYCLNNSSDWLQMHDCISRYDPSTRFTGQ
ncbi:MAG TPA: hypothetical protein VNH44_16680 [Micropepsaceae bacterium]|nr:hypothetical protein [Micropepsaceae bacterium]